MECNDYKFISGEPLQEKSVIDDFYITDNQFKESILRFKTVEFGKKSYLENKHQISFDTQPQMLFNKQFELIIDQWITNYEQGISNIFSSLNENQSQRVRNIVRDILSTQKKYADYQEDERKKLEKELVSYVSYTLHEGFTDKEQKIAF